MTHINSLENLHGVFDRLPEGTTANILASDLEAGNFDVAHIVMPEVPLPPGSNEVDLRYTGPVAEGYVSPFEVGEETEEAL